jgi:hypothetical protein
MKNANITLKYQEIFSHTLTKDDQVKSYLDSLKNKSGLLIKGLPDTFIFPPIKKNKLKNIYELCLLN